MLARSIEEEQEVVEVECLLVRHATVGLGLTVDNLNVIGGVDPLCSGAQLLHVGDRIISLNGEALHPNPNPNPTPTPNPAPSQLSNLAPRLRPARRTVAGRCPNMCELVWGEPGTS